MPFAFTKGIRTYQPQLCQARQLASSYRCGHSSQAPMDHPFGRTLRPATVGFL